MASTSNLTAMFAHHVENADVPLLQLPVEIILCICDELRLHGQFTLSQTCRCLRAAVHQHWPAKLASLPQDDQIAFWSDIAYITPDRWACAECCMVHPINLNAADDATDYLPLSVKLFFGIAGHKLRIDEGISNQKYDLFQSNVQVALKFSRMNHLSPAQHQFLNKLLRPFEMQRVYHGGLKKYYKAEPEIIDGRFSLRQNWQFFDIGNGASGIGSLDVLNQRLLNALDSYESPLRLCRHVSTGPLYARNEEGDWRLSNQGAVAEFRRAFGRAFIYPGTPCEASCPDCRTTCSILVRQLYRMAWTVRISSVADLGTEMPLNPAWMAQMRDFIEEEDDEDEDEFDDEDEEEEG